MTVRCEWCGALGPPSMHPECARLVYVFAGLSAAEVHAVCRDAGDPHLAQREDADPLVEAARLEEMGDRLRAARDRLYPRPEETDEEEAERADAQYGVIEAPYRSGYRRCGR